MPSNPIQRGLRQSAIENKVIAWYDLLFIPGGIKDDRILNAGLIDLCALNHRLTMHTITSHG